MEQVQRRVMELKLAPLETVTGLTAEVERLEVLGEELSRQLQLRLAAFGRVVCWFVRSRWTHQSTFLGIRRQERTGKSSP